MSDWEYNEHICLSREQRYESLGMCKHGLWKHEDCKECAEEKAKREQDDE